MSQSPAESFFARQAALSSQHNPMARINEAVGSHQARLAERTEARRQELAAYDQTAVGRLGFDSDSTAGGIYNAIESLKNAAVKGIGIGASAIPDSISLAEQADIPADIHGMYDRFAPHRDDYARMSLLRDRRDGTGTTKRPLIGSEALELARLESEMSGWGVNQAEIDQLNATRTRNQVNQPTQFGEGELPTQVMEGPAQQTVEMPRSYLESIDLGGQLNTLAQGIRDTTNNDALIDQRNVNAFTEEVMSGSEEGISLIQNAFNSTEDDSLKERWLDGALGFSSLAVNAFDAIARNPAGFTQTVTNELVESLGGMVVAGAAGVTATNVGYSVEAYQKGIENYKAAHDGAMPDADTQEHMAQNAFLAFVLNSGADAAALKVMGAASRHIPRTDGVAGAATQMASAPAKLAGSAGVQGVTEIGATYAEGEAAYAPASAQDLYYSAVVGAGMGGTVGAPGAVREEVAATVDMVRELAGKAGIGTRSETAQAEIQTFAEAMANNDTSAYSDPASEQYAPSRAMAVLFGNSHLADTSPEQKKANRDQGAEIIRQATQQRDVAAADWSVANPEARQQQQATIATLEQQLAEAAPEEAAQIQGDLELFKSMLAESDALSAKQVRDRKRAYEKAESELEAALKIKENLDKDVPYVPEEIESILASVTAPTDEASGQQAAESVINLAMEQPDLFTPEQVQSLVADEGNSLSPIQRDYLRAFSASKDAENQLKSMGTVTQDIMVGAHGYKGLPEYRANIAKAVRYGSTDRAQQEMNQLQSFSDSHTQKAALAQQANDQALATGEPVQLVRTKEGQWALTQGVENYRKGGGLQFDGDDKGTRLVTTITTEAGAITAAIAEANAVMALVPAAVAPVAPTPTMTEEVANVEAPTPAPVTDTNPSRVTETTAAEPATTVTPTETETAPSESGTLSAFANSNNAVLQYFKQTGAKGDGAARRALVASKDFLTQMGTTPKVVSQFIKGAITPKQSKALNSFLRSAKAWAPLVQKSLPKQGDPEYMYKDVVQAFTNEDGSFDENFVTAISAAAYTWVAETGTGVAYNNEEAINAILGRPRSNPVSSAEKEAFASIGTRRNQVINSLGKRAAQALGLSAADDNTPLDQVSRLESGLGTHAYNILKDEGVIVDFEMSAEAMASYRQMDSTTTPENTGGHVFTRVAGSTNMEAVSPIAEAIVEANRQSDTVINRLFGIDSDGIAPSFAPVPFSQKTAQKSSMTIPGVQRKALEQHNKKAYKFRVNDMAKLMDVLPREALAAMAGYVNADTTFVHPNNVTSVEAKNKGIEREIDAYYDFLAMVEDQKNGRSQLFYIGHAVWVQQRVGMASRMINLQSSKIHRHLVQMDGWEQKDVAIDPTDERFNQFRLGVADALGIKTDALSQEAALTKLDEKLDSDLMKQGVITLRKILNDQPLADRDIELLVDAITEGGEKYHTLDGLMAHAQYMDALETGASSFTHNLTREIDGKTNGPMLTQILTGAASSVQALQEMVEKGGFFSREDGPRQVNAWASEQGNNDLYQSVAKAIADVAEPMVQGNPEQYKALFTLTDPLTEDGAVTKGGRNATKTPVTQVNFGSSVKNTVDSMGAEFADKLLGKVEEIINKHRDANTDPNPELKELGAAVQILTGIKLGPKQLTGKLHNNVGKALQSAYVRLLGDAIESGINAHYDMFLSTRNQINGAGRLAFGLYNALRTVRHDQLVKTQVAKNSAGKPKHDLNREQLNNLEASLKGVEPMVHTAMSKLSGDIRAGFSLIKQKEKLSSEAFYQTEAKFGESGFANVNGKRTKSTKVSGKARELQDRGVGALVLLVHAFDSAISTLSYRDQIALNVHDANIVAADMTQAQAKRLNENTFKLLMGYSIPTEMAESLSRTVDGFLVEVKKDPNNKALRDAYKALLEDAKRGMRKEDFVLAKALGLDPLGYQLLKMKQTAQQADITKLEAMKQWQAVDQYSMDGGNYVVTADDHAEIDKLLAERRLDNPSTQMDSAKEIAAIMQSDNIAVDNTPDTKPDVKTWGTQGTPKQASHQGLTDFLARRKTVSAKEVMAFIATDPNQDNSTPFQKTLLAKLRQVVGDVSVVFVTPGMAVPEGTKERAVGWFHQDKDGKQTIYVRSPDFAASRIDPELMLHELVHAATANTMKQHRGQKGEVADILADLEDLRSKVVEHLAADSERTHQYGPAIASIEELVAWGMTNEGFQQVLKEVQVAPRSVPNSLVDGMKAFIKSLVGLLFSGNTSRQEMMESGLTRLVSNSAGLMAATAQATGEINLSQESVDPVDNVMRWTTDQVFEALARPSDNASAAHKTHLSELLGSLVARLHGPFGAFTTEAKQSQALTPDEVFIKALQEGKAPFASDTLAAGFVLSQQEQFVLEQVEATVAASLNSSHTAYKELAKIYQQARSGLRNNPVLTADHYSFLFTMTPGADGRSAHLSRFAALAMTYEPLRKELQALAPVDADVAENASLATRIQAWFNQLLQMVNERITGTYGGQTADTKIRTLADQLVHIEAKRKMRLANERANPFDFIEAGIRKGSEKGRQIAGTIGESKFFRDSDNGYVKGAGQVLSSVARDRVGSVIEQAQILRDKHFKNRQGMVSAIISEMTGADDKTKTLFMMNRMTKNIERVRIERATQAGAQVLGSFANKGTTLTKEEKDGLTKVLLRTDMASLVDAYSMDDLHKMLSDRNYLNQERARLENAVSRLPMGKMYSQQADDLGKFLVTGKNYNPMLQLNAHNIAHLYGFEEASRVEVTPELIAMIDQLVTLNALSRSDVTDIQSVVGMERTRGEESGIEFTLRLAKHQKEQSLEKLFKGSPVLMTKGYTKEITDPYKSVVAAPISKSEEMKQKGYSESPDLIQDPADNSEGMRLYVIDDGGLKRYLSGAMSLTGQRAKGSELHGGLVPEGTTAVALDRLEKTEKMVQAKRRLLKKPNSFNTQGHMVPVFNEKGEVVNFRYMMTHATRDGVLGRNNALDAVMGGLEGELMDKVASPEHNRNIVEALREVYKADYAIRPDSYLSVSAASTDPRLREIYRMLPRDTKAAIKSVWGREEMLVRADVLDLMFGYRKYSAADALDKAAEERNVIEKVWVGTVEALFKDQAGIKVRKYEDILQQVVKHVKDIVVVKNVTTLLGNVASNTTQLLWHGVNPVALVKDHKVAMESAINYRRDKRELDNLVQRQAMGYITDGETNIAQRIPELQDALARNPSTPLIESGMMPTIVEDIDLIQDPYSYQSKTADKLDKWVSKVPESVRNVGKQVYMTHDTTTYKVLSQGTQLSDYVARYTLYQHVRNRDVDPMGHDDALEHVMEAFINYDVPTHRNLQYMNDMGFVYFTKYYLRIQRVILSLYRDNPARALALVMFNGYFDAIPTLMDSQMTERLGNPLSEGALRYGDVLDQLATVRAAGSVFQ